jgi:hypothetical protein
MRALVQGLPTIPNTQARAAAMKQCRQRKENRYGPMNAYAFSRFET